MHHDTGERLIQAAKLRYREHSPCGALVQFTATEDAILRAVSDRLARIEQRLSALETFKHRAEHAHDTA